MKTTTNFGFHLSRKGKIKENVMDTSFDFLLFSQYTFNSKVVIMYVWFKNLKKKNIKKNKLFSNMFSLLKTQNLIFEKKKKKRKKV